MQAFHRLRDPLRRTRHRPRRQSRDPSERADVEQIPRVQVAQSQLAVDRPGSSFQHAWSSISSLSFSRARESSQEPPSTKDGAEQAQSDQVTLPPVARTSSSEQISAVSHSALGVNIEVVVVSSDLWSAAYREAVDTLGEDINIAILKGENVAQLFKQLEKIDKEATQESVFLRGVRYLHSLQVPLEKFKLALDLASPVTNIEPTAATVFGVVRGVTALAISFSTADVEFAKQIGEMLEQISYIDDCDTLGQRANKVDIHKALVLVYQKLLEFYNVAFEILTRKGAKLVLKMVLENDRLPNIVKDFLKHADNLRKLVQKATLEIVEDIKSMLYDHEISRWLGSGKMTQQSQYHAYLQNLRADQACEFLLADPKFRNWYSAPNSQQLVILGDTGCGKTVAMAFLVDEIRRRSEHQLPQPKVCYHYCQDNETGQAAYIFPSLILSLLEQLSGLKRIFFEWYKQVGACGSFGPATNIKKLEEFLQDTLATLDRPLFIVIDGLDECDRGSRNNLLKSLRTLSQKTSRLKIILSSRPQEEILEQLNEVAKINLGSDLKRDSIIVETTVKRQLSYLSTDVRALVIERLSHLARGSAIWTKMTVELIEIRGIRALGPMSTFLEEIPHPGQLSELYINLFSRYTSNDPENQKIATTALKTLAIARRPLSILELAWAIALGAAEKEVTSVTALAKLVDHQRVMSLIQPFVAQVDFGDLKKRQVRLVHQSAKEFIIKQWASSGPGLDSLDFSTGLDQALIYQRVQTLEADILNICTRYLLLDDFNHTNLFSDEQVAIGELPQEYNLFSDDEAPNTYDVRCTWEVWEEGMIRFDPTDRGFGEFFIYASCHWLEHFGVITAVPFSSLGNIEDLCHVGSIRMQNWINQYRRPECAIQPRFPFDSRLYDPLSITSLYGSKVMLQDMLESSDFDNGKFLPDPAIGTADQILQWGDLSRLRMLFLRNKVGDQLRNLEFFRVVMRQWSFSKGQYQDWNACRDWEGVFDLVNEILDVLIKERWGNELLCIAANIGCMPMIQLLMDGAQRNAKLRAELLRAPQRKPQTRYSSQLLHQSIGEAVLGNHVDVVEYLIGQQDIEAHLRHRNLRGENVLQLASRLCNPIMFRLLAPHFKESADQTDDERNAVLVQIMMSSSPSQDRYDSAKILLLESNARENGSSGDEDQEPLRVAVRLGDFDMCYLLLCIGKSDPLSALTYGDDGEMLLKDKTCENPQNMITILELLRSHIDQGPESIK